VRSPQSPAHGGAERCRRRGAPVIDAQQLRERRGDGFQERSALPLRSQSSGSTPSGKRPHRRTHGPRRELQ
jgi:hypothetical protein